jgi:hypothetical protein
LSFILPLLFECELLSWATTTRAFVRAMGQAARRLNEAVVRDVELAHSPEARRLSVSFPSLADRASCATVPLSISALVGLVGVGHGLVATPRRSRGTSPAVRSLVLGRRSGRLPPRKEQSVKHVTLRSGISRRCRVGAALCGRAAGLRGRV